MTNGFEWVDHVDRISKEIGGLIGKHTIEFGVVRFVQGGTSFEIFEYDGKYICRTRDNDVVRSVSSPFIYKEEMLSKMLEIARAQIRGKFRRRDVCFSQPPFNFFK